MKKTLSVLLSILMMLSVITPFSAIAEEKAVTVQYSVYDGYYTFKPQNVTVSSDLSKKYKDQIGYDDEKEYPTVLDATIAAHIAMFGEDFTSSDYFTCNSSGWIKSAFGKSTSAVSYRLNGQSCYNFSEEIKANDYIEFDFYQDDLGYSDLYVDFDKREVTTTVGTTVSITAKYDGYDASFQQISGFATNLNIIDFSNKSYGKTNSNGVFSFTPVKAGVYELTAVEDINGTKIFAPYCKITVKENNLYAEATNDIQDEVAYLNINPTLATSVDAYTLSRANALQSVTFLGTVKQSLITNKGKIKIVNSKKEKVEDATTYAAIINILVNEDTDPTSFGGYDIVKAFESLTDKTVTNPYYYRVIIEACKNINNDNLAKEYIDKLIKENYTMGKGMNYWGYSCDNTAMFLTAIAPYKDDYKAYVEDAIKVIDSYTTSKGCFYNDTYTDISPDSTAVALMAYSAIGKYDMANFLYRCLMDGFESKTDNGVIVLNGSNNDYATKEALLALTYFDATKVKHTNIVTDDSVKATCITEGKTEGKHCKDCGEIFVAQKVIKALGDEGHNPVVSVKAKSATHFATGKTAEYKCSVCGKVTTKSKSVAKKKATISKLSAGKKSFKITTKKVDKATGYQIQYSTNSSFKNAKSYKTKYTTKTISKLKAKKKYYVRVRAYKKSNGKTTYSSWSASKTVKTK